MFMSKILSTFVSTGFYPVWYHTWLAGSGGTPGNYWWGCADRSSKSWPYFRVKKMSFFAPVFRPGLLKEIMSSLLRLVQQQKDFLKSISNSHISLSFLLICLGTLLSSYPPNVGVQDLVVNCDNQHWRDEETGGSVPTISVWNCSFYYRSVWADL